MYLSTIPNLALHCIQITKLPQIFLKFFFKYVLRKYHQVPFPKTACKFSLVFSRELGEFGIVACRKFFFCNKSELRSSQNRVPGLPCQSLRTRLLSHLLLTTFSIQTNSSAEIIHSIIYSNVNKLISCCLQDMLALRISAANFCLSYTPIEVTYIINCRQYEYSNDRTT